MAKYEGLAGLIGVACIFCGLFALDGGYGKEKSFYLGAIFWAMILYAFVFRYLKGYSTFDTIKQKELDRWTVWLLTSIVGFVLFTCIFTGIRKSIFGF